MRIYVYIYLPLVDLYTLLRYFPYVCLRRVIITANEIRLKEYRCYTRWFEDCKIDEEKKYCSNSSRGMLINFRYNQSADNGDSETDNLIIANKPQYPHA